MGRAPCCPKVGVHRGPWTAREDALLIDYIKAHGEGQWKSLPEKAGLLRCGKSCRLRWMNYLRPEVKRGNITPEEDDLIIRLHALLGNRWSLIAGRLPGRTDNEIKNYWNTHLSKRLPNNQNVLLSSSSSKKRNNNNNNNRDSNRRASFKQQYKKNSSEISKLKVYLPKAVRVGSTFLSLYLTRNEDKGGGSTTSSQSLRVSGKSDEVLPCESSSVFELQENRDLEMPRMAANGANNISDDDDNNNTLDEVYEEYLQLLGATDHQHHTELDDPLLHSGDILVRSSSPVL